VYTASGVKGAG